MQDKKLRVLIVDDEFHIAMLIKKLIRWDEIGLECVNAVDNGEIALRIIADEKPDIVITDIRMPKINGLDLIRITKENNQSVKFIVISGYKEFEYAHTALQFGVNDYLLKPINEEELNKVLIKINSEKTKEIQIQKEGEQLKKTVIASEQIIKSNLLNSIIDQTQSPASIEEMQAEYNLSLNAAVYRGIDIKLDYWDYEKNDKKQDKMTVEKIVMIIENNLKDNVKEYLICEKDNLNIYCLINYDIIKAKEIIDLINNILSQIQEYLIGFEQYKVTIGVGSENTEFGDIRFSINAAYRAVQNRIKLGTGRLIYAESLPGDNRFDLEKFMAKYKDKYLQSIESLSKETFENIINQIYSEFQFKDDIDFSCCYVVANELINLFFENISVQSSEGNQLKQYLSNAYQHCYTFSSLKGLLKDNISQYLDACLVQLETETTKPIRQAKKYIDEHFSEKIVLEDISNQVDLNPVYFSVLFKKETGMNFSAYLIHIRMEAAKEMIRTSNKTIAAIADEVGYKDTRHFSQIFTKTVGIKPALYRKLYS